MPEEKQQPRIPFQRVAHTGDLALLVHGRDLPELFVNAARALFAVMCGEAQDNTIERRLALDAGDTEALLVDWLNQLILLHEVEWETYTRFELEEFTPTHLQARIYGGPTGEKLLVVKAATFHELRIIRTDEGVEATIVFDI